MPPNAPVVMPTLAIVVIVRRHPDRPTPWLAHHARSGVDEVAMYSTPETRVAVERTAEVLPSQRTVKVHDKHLNIATFTYRAATIV